MRIFAVLLLATGAHAAFQLSPAYLREVEKKHARLAMLALPTLVGLAATGHDPATGWLASQPFEVQADFFSAAGVIEAAATLPRFKDDLELRDDVRPGEFFGWSGGDEANAAEDAVGRVAMAATAAWMLADVLGVA